MANQTLFEHLTATLYDYVMETQNDFDTYDTEYDAIVTVCFIDDEDDEYDKFCNGIIKKVRVKSIKNDIITVDWTGLIKQNMAKFKEFTRKYWNYQYDDDEDEFIYQWINEIHLYMAGYVSDSMYKKLHEFVETLE